MKNSPAWASPANTFPSPYAVSDKPIGCVASQTPEAGYITREEDIVLILSAEPVEVPQLTGLTSRARRRRPRRRA